MAELRRDPLSGRWVVVAPKRATRPQAFARSQIREDTAEACPFCPGREGLTPPELLSFPSSRDDPTAPGWEVRVFANRYPAFLPDREPRLRRVGTHWKTPAFGFHEVVVHGPDHRGGFPSLGAETSGKVVRAWQARILAHASHPRIRASLVIVNHGRGAGASVTHPHSQIVSTPSLPPLLQGEAENIARYARRRGECLLCRLLEEEEREGVRVVLKEEGFLVVAPFASGYPFELLLAPRSHQPRFEEIEPRSAEELGAALADLFGLVERALRDPPYNLWLHTAPHGGRGPFHWHIHVVPRVTGIGSFELGAGIPINILDPTEAASFLRSAHPQSPEGQGCMIPGRGN